jgi:hypothetical protein
VLLVQGWRIAWGRGWLEEQKLSQSKLRGGGKEEGERRGEERREGAEMGEGRGREGRGEKVFTRRAAGKMSI